MRSKKRLLTSWKIYAIIDGGLFPERRCLLSKFRVLLDSPVDAIQFRPLYGETDGTYALAREMSCMAKRKKIPFILNDRPETALCSGADGVHLGSADVPVSTARKILGPAAIIGRTIRSEKDLVSDDVREADYVSVGPVFRTPTKPGFKTTSRDTLNELVSRKDISLVAIGGITDRNAGELVSIGIRTVSFMRYAVTSGDTKRKIGIMRKIMDGSPA